MEVSCLKKKKKTYTGYPVLKRKEIYKLTHVKMFLYQIQQNVAVTTAFITVACSHPPLPSKSPLTTVPSSEPLGDFISKK